MLELPRGDLNAELLWRDLVWDDLQAQPDWPAFRAAQIQDRRVFRGGRGIWVDLEMTSQVAEHGVAVSVKHTGAHYDDQLDDRGEAERNPWSAGVRLGTEVRITRDVLKLGLPKRYFAVPLK